MKKWSLRSAVCWPKKIVREENSEGGPSTSLTTPLRQLCNCTYRVRILAGNELTCIKKRKLASLADLWEGIDIMRKQRLVTLRQFSHLENTIYMVLLPNSWGNSWQNTATEVLKPLDKPSVKAAPVEKLTRKRPITLFYGCFCKKKILPAYKMR